MVTLRATVTPPGRMPRPSSGSRPRLAGLVCFPRGRRERGQDSMLVPPTLSLEAKKEKERAE